jgi:hypothetical protein
MDALPSFQEDRFGATITTIQGSDTLKALRTTINDNFSNLNADKLEISDYYGTTTHATITSLPALTSASVLATIGTITSGVWNGMPLLSAYGGTGTTTFPAYHVLIASSTGAGIMSVSGLGSSGQFLTSQGVGAPPHWTTSSIDEAGTYNWTGNHHFRVGTTTDYWMFASSTSHSLHATTFTASSTAIVKDLTIQDLCLGCQPTTTIITAADMTDAGAGALAIRSEAVIWRETNDGSAGAINAGPIIVPPGVTGITSISFYYFCDDAGTLKWTSDSSVIQAGYSAVTADTDGAEGSATCSGTIDKETLGSDVYNGLSSISENDLFSVELAYGDGAAGEDYAADFDLISFEIIWTY